LTLGLTCHDDGKILSFLHVLNKNNAILTTTKQKLNPGFSKKNCLGIFIRLIKITKNNFFGPIFMKRQAIKPKSYYNFDGKSRGKCTILFSSTLRGALSKHLFLMFFCHLFDHLKIVKQILHLKYYMTKRGFSILPISKDISLVLKYLWQVNVACGLKML
jgi:hypothetical protein